MIALSKITLLAGSAALAGLFTVSQAQAQSAPTAAPETTETGQSDIIVTAQKREARLKDVPAAVTAVTGADLQDLNATKLDDYVARIPGLVVAQAGGANAGTQLAIRGVTAGVGGNPTVGIYIDESPFGASTGVGGFTVPDLDPQDLARVEVLRGPQGTLYGAGSLGGLLKYVTADPDPTRFFGRLQVDGSKVDGGETGYGVRGAANMPIADDLALRVSSYFRRDPGFVDNVQTGRNDINDNRYYGGRAALGWQIAPGWKLRLSALYQGYDGEPGIVDYNSATFEPSFGDLKQSRARGTTDTKQAAGAYSLLVEGDLGFATLTSASSYNRQKANFHIDYSSVLSPIFAPLYGLPGLGFDFYSSTIVDKVTQEVRLTSSSANKLSWQVGGFFTDETQDVTSSVDGIDSSTGQPIALVGSVGGTLGHVKFREIAAFANATYRFSEAFDVTLGIRYSENKQRFGTTVLGIFGTGTRNSRSRDHAVTYLVNPRLRLNENTMIYARVASGFRPGGPNAVPVGVPQSYGPDRVTNYELGMKADLLDRKLNLEVAGYVIDWKDIQIQRVGALGGFIDNGPKAKSKGVEATATVRPTHGLELYGNVSYNDAHLTEDLPVGSAIGLSGDKMPLTARWSGAAGATYTVPVSGAWNASFGIDWRHVGDRLGAFPNPGTARFQLPSYDTVDLRASLSDDKWTFSIFAKNIGDARGLLTDVTLGVGTTSVSVIQPRTFGISAATKF